MDKELLVQYSELKEEIKDLRKRIQKLEKFLSHPPVVADVVKGTRKDGTIGPIKITGIPEPEYVRRQRICEKYQKLLQEVSIPKEEVSADAARFAGVNFVITGSVHYFANRGEVKELIESKGGKVTGSVTSKTNYLINNDVQSTSSKNKKARELGVPIISEEEFLEMIQ